MVATRVVDGWQGVIAFVGITLGVIPLVMALFGGSSGLWTLVLGDTGPLRWICPLVVLVVGVAALAALERRKRTHD